MGVDATRTTDFVSCAALGRAHATFSRIIAENVACVHAVNIPVNNHRLGCTRGGPRAAGNVFSTIPPPEVRCDSDPPHTGRPIEADQPSSSALRPPLPVRRRQAGEGGPRIGPTGRDPTRIHAPDPVLAHLPSTLHNMYYTNQSEPPYGIRSVFLLGRWQFSGASAAASGQGRSCSLGTSPSPGFRPVPPGRKTAEAPLGRPRHLPYPRHAGGGAAAPARRQALSSASLIS